MNGEGMEEAVKMEVNNERLVFMWGYLPGALPQRSPISSPLAVRSTVYAWKDVCGGGCGFAMAISESGKLITWGSTDDLGQSYVTSGKHGVVLHHKTLQLHSETPEAFPLPTEASIVRAAAGWAHCVAATAQTMEKSIHGDGKNVFPQGKSLEIHQGQGREDQQRMRLKDRIFSPHSQGSRSSGGSGTLSGVDGRGSGDESTKRRRISSAKQAAESSSAGDETLSAFPCLVTLNPGVRVATVAAGGRHTLALSDIGQVWGWGYGGEGQLGLGSRIRMVSSPHPIPCIESAYGKDRAVVLSRGGMASEGQSLRVPGSYVKGIACGGRHSAVITDAGALLTFGWGLYGQCGQGSTDDELSPTCVSSLLGIRIEAVAAGLWHTVCVSADGDVYAFGGNQFGQLGTGGDQAEKNLSTATATTAISESSPLFTAYIYLNHSCFVLEELLFIADRTQKVTRLLEFEISVRAWIVLSTATATTALYLDHHYCTMTTYTSIIAAVLTNVLFLNNSLWLTSQFIELVHQTLPRLLEAPSLENIHAKTVSCGARHSAIFTEDGKVFCWGWNKYGQLGLGDVIDRNIPSQVPIDGCVPKAVACGWWHTLLLAEPPT
ncbi:hypothetical protein SADUNF_Sadunf10G0153100 [Salix dunnii]|uniref:Ultraviolet-B receptor UVR8 n=1 Tax=Salix dunnii TaxID=1413687 RepID=A0A835MR77_9ROSI|nr:hypothetical protein SADUNF_Sadunf10G0153100 [Salix dunnii]